MHDDSAPTADPAELFGQMLRMQGEAARQVVEALAPSALAAVPGDDDLADWARSIGTLQAAWLGRHGGPAGDEPQDAHAGPAGPLPLMADPGQWLGLMQGLWQHAPWLDPARQQAIWTEGVRLWGDILNQYGADQTAEPDLPRQDRRFADPAWRRQPVFALIHQTYLLLAERIGDAVDQIEGLDTRERDQLRFATRTVLDALAPSNFPLMNPLVMERTIATGGENLVRGMERLAADLERGRLTHADESQFEIGRNIAATPGQVVFETELFQLIQYGPSTQKVGQIPLIVFPPWINRFYILDLSERKSFVRWVVDQGLTVFMVSWRSADAGMADVCWDHYVRAQIEAIDHVCQRLGVQEVHAIGYCVAGTTLAATLAVLARRGQAGKVASATFLTAQVDFEQAGELKLFIDDAQLDLIRQASKGGYLDGRYMAATFNLLRGSDLIWNTVVNHYLLGEDYPAFDLLFWNGDVTNLPARWHEAYLRDLYRDNLLVQPDALSADGTPIDLRLIAVPAYVQAGREDHIAPAESVLRLLPLLKGPARFVLAGSGHIAGVVNPPAAGKYQYWTGDSAAGSIDEFLATATEHPGSWWTDWIGWIRGIDPHLVRASGRRRPGGAGDTVIEPAPGRYVRMR